MKRTALLGLFLTSVLCVAAPAFAQDIDTTPPTGTGPTTTDPLAVGAARATPPDQEPSATPSDGLLSGVGKSLAQKGITFRGLFTGEPADSLSGGVRQKYDTASQFYFGVDLDLEKILGIKGGSFHVTEYRDVGEGLAKNNSGTFVKQQDIYKNEFPQFHLGLISYEQKLFDNRLDIIVGRLGSTAYFGHLAPNCYFQSGATCGIPSILNSETGFTLLPSATWGANFKYKFSPHTYIDAGAFEINPFIAHTDGFTFGTHYSTGTSYAVEWGYENTDLKKTDYPTEFKFGYYAGTANRASPFFNTKGQSIGISGGTAFQETNLRQGAWVMGSRTIWRPDLSKPNNITLFGGYVQPFEKEEVMDAQVFSGLLWRGPLHGRDADTIGFTFTYFHVSPQENEFLRDSRIKAGGPGGLNDPNQFVSELNYGIQLTRSIRVTPNFQYIIHPDNSTIPKINFVPKNLSVVGVKVVIDLAKLVGLPSAGAGGD